MIKKRTTSLDVRVETKIITGMIVNKQFLVEVQSLYRPDIQFALSYSKTVANWCFEYLKHYDDAPKQYIKDIFLTAQWVDDTEKETVQRFLTRISEKNEETQFNTKFYIKEAEKYFNKKLLLQIRSKLVTAIDMDNIDNGLSIIGEFKRVARTSSQGVEPITDRKAINKAFIQDNKGGLFTLPGELGRVCGSFKRGHLWCILAKEKTGKSFWLLDWSVRAVKAGCNTLFISLEMSEEANTIRIHSILHSQPSKIQGQVLIPIFDCILNQNNECQKRERTCGIGLLNDEGQKPRYIKEIDSEGNQTIIFNSSTVSNYNVCTQCRGTSDYFVGSWFKVIEKESLTPDIAARKGMRVDKYITRGKVLKQVQFPTGSTIEEIMSYISRLELFEEFKADVLIVDFADKMRTKKVLPELEMQKEIWTGLKAYAQKEQCLVLTANQSNATRTGADTRRGNVAGTILKLGEVDGMIALNQTHIEQAERRMRVSVLASRHKDFSEMRDVVVLYEYGIGRVYLDSYSWGE